MPIAIIKDLLATATKPVARLYFKNDSFKIIFIGFNTGMILAQHTAPTHSKLLVLEGKVVYIQEGIHTTLEQFQSIDIQPHIVHEVQALENSLCMLTQGH